jgi:hypothetical protein
MQVLSSHAKGGLSLDPRSGPGSPADLRGRVSATPMDLTHAAYLIMGVPAVQTGRVRGSKDNETDPRVMA